MCLHVARFVFVILAESPGQELITFIWNKKFVCIQSNRTRRQIESLSIIISHLSLLPTFVHTSLTHTFSLIHLKQSSESERESEQSRWNINRPSSLWPSFGAHRAKPLDYSAGLLWISVHLKGHLTNPSHPQPPSYFGYCVEWDP